LMNHNYLLLNQVVPFQLNIHPSSFLPNYQSFQATLQNENLLKLLSYQQLCYKNQLAHLQLLRQINLPSHKILLEETCSSTLSTPLVLNTMSKFQQGDILEKKQKEDTNRNFLRAQIAQMLTYFVNYFGKASKEEVNSERNKYIFNKSLLGLFDSLAEKYALSGKCKEDMIRFVLRKTISCFRNNLRKNHNLSSKAASMMLCKKYFKIEAEEILNQINIENEEELLGFLLPYKKNSRNKTANNCFVAEIFASEVFRSDYTQHLENFDHLLNDDNQKKIDKFIEFSIICIENGTISKVKKYKRLPWLKVWLESTKILACELLNTTAPQINAKKMKQN